MLLGLMSGGTAADVKGRILRIFDSAIVQGGNKRACPANNADDDDDGGVDDGTDVAADV